MIFKGINDIHSSIETINGNNPEMPSVPKHDIVLVSAGAAMDIIGLVLVPTGLALGVSGAVRYRKYCSNGRAFYISPSNQGLGLACKF